MTEEPTVDARQEIAKQKDQVMRKASVYLLLTVATALSVMLWIYYGAIIALGFIFLEVQFLLAISTMGVSAGVLEQISQMLRLLTQGSDVDYHYHHPQHEREEKISKSRENLDKVVESTKLKAAK